MNRRRLDEALGLKDLPRTGWARRGVPGPESVAAHSWGVAHLALRLCPPGLDLARVLGMAVIHDLPEVRTGDLTPADPVPLDERRRAERAAADALLGDAPVLRALWAEYREGRTPEARFVHDLDRLDMGLQALRYAREGRLSAEALAEFLASARAGITDPALRALLDEGG